MPMMSELQDRSRSMFADLLDAELAAPGPGGLGADVGATFSWFDADSQLALAEFSVQLAARAAAGDTVEDGLDAVLDDVARRRLTEDPALVRQGLAIFVTHNAAGRNLVKPRTVAAAPGYFEPPRRPTDGGVLPASIGGESPELDYWREDALANEHHEHWHQVYPTFGLPPKDFAVWVEAIGNAALAEILHALQPDPTWESRLDAATTAQIATFFADLAAERVFAGLPSDLYRRIFTLNDRHGELFFYMHQQMLARYDAELAAHALAPVEPFGPAAWTQPIPSGHDPDTLAGFGRRDPFERLPQDSVDRLTALAQPLEDALAAGVFRAADGTDAPIDRTNIGEAVEAVAGQLTDLDGGRYRGLHNFGHGLIAALSTPGPGVMTSTVTAIRDQVFWRWHRYVDSFNRRWQDTQEPNDESGLSPVVLRGAADGTAWASPDVVVCRRSDDDVDLDAHAVALFADDTAPAAADPSSALQPTPELTTTMRTRQGTTGPVEHLTHERFSWVLRVANSTAVEQRVTARIFVAPLASVEDRGAWIEMDKWTFTCPPNETTVHHRADTDSSVIKKPADTDPDSVTAAAHPAGTNYCDCGWPYTLLLPRSGDFAVAVVCTDTEFDQAAATGDCGSLSFCGAVDRYPDTRNMGFPFDRPFPADVAGTPVASALHAWSGAGTTSLRIRHVP